MHHFQLVKEYKHEREYLVEGTNIFLLVGDCGTIGYDKDEVNVHYSDGNGEIVDYNTLVELREEWGDKLDDETALLYVQCFLKDVA